MQAESYKPLHCLIQELGQYFGNSYILDRVRDSTNILLGVDILETAKLFYKYSKREN